MTNEQLDELIEKTREKKIKRGEVVAPIKEEEIVDKSSPEYLESKVAKLEEKLAKYEDNGVAKLYYSLNNNFNAFHNFDFSIFAFCSAPCMLCKLPLNNI
jgi:hypothetical protein